MKTLPIQRQTIDMVTGEVTATDTVQFKILPPPAGTCPDCAVKHDPSQPHNVQSLHYQYAFFGEHGRWPTWSDAMAHCSEDMRRVWTEELVRMGVDVAGGQILPPKDTA